MFAELESNDERLHEAFGLLEYKNTKRAITEINKSLKKNPKSPSANALKALILLRSSKLSEAYELMTSVMQGTPADRDTLQFLSIFFRELKKEETLESYLKSALKKYPENKDLHLGLFYIYVRSCNFNAQQATARKLCQIDNSDRSYKFWMALSTMLQGEKDAASATRLFLPLAEKMLVKALNDGHFTSHDDFSVYLSILLRLNKFEEVNKLLNDEKLIGLLNTLDYDHDYNPLLLKVNSHLGNWAEMVKISEKLLNVDADNWLAWESLLRHCFDDECRRNTVLELIEKYLKASPKSRGPRLAVIDFSANLIKLDIKHPKAEESFCVQLVKDYFRDFSRKPVGSLDLAFVIPLLVKSDSARISLVKSLLKEAGAYQKLPKLSEDDKIHSEVCAYRLARTNGVPIDLVELINNYQTRAMVPLPDEKDLTKETIAYDGLLQLAVSELLDPVARDDKTTENGLGRILLAAHWLSEIGLRRSPANHFMRLKLVAILSPFGGLACVGRLLQELKALNMKEILYISTCHVAITPGPFLAAFGNRSLVSISSASDPQYANLISFYEGTIKRVRGIQREMENCLMRSYRRNTFGSVHETTQFLQMLGRTDVFILAQAELIYNKVLVKCDCFDDFLEQMGQCSSEVTRIKEVLANIYDNRDFSVVPEFYHKIPDENSRKLSFDNLRAWTSLRLDIINLIGTCSKLVMKAVPCIDMISSGNVSEHSMKNLADIVRTIDEQEDALVAHLNTYGDVASAFESSKFKYTDLLFVPEMVCTTPPPLPSTTMTSFYFHGPFYQTLVNGIDVLKFLTGLLEDKSNKPLVIDDHSSLHNLFKPLLQFLGESSGISGLPSPPQNTPPLTDTLNPSAVLVGFAVAFETLSLAVVLATSAVAMLRPRSMAHQSHVNKSSKKGKKKQQQSNEARTQNVVTSPVAKHLDQAAIVIRTILMPQIQHIAAKLQELSQAWADWSSEKAAKAFTATAEEAAKATLTTIIEANEAFPWLPTSSSDIPPSIYKQIASDLTCGFTELAEAFGRKTTALSNVLCEVECFASLKITGDDDNPDFMDAAGEHGSSPSSQPDSTTTQRRTVRNEDVKRKEDEAGPSTSSTSPAEQQQTPSTSTSGNFECNICLDQATDAVVSRCGHLFCWPCLHQWMEVKKARAVCPVCKAAISRDSVIPLYGRGADHKQDPRNKVPPRPQGVRAEPERQRESPFSPFNIFGGNADVGGGGGSGGVQVSFGFVPFPFGLLTTSFNLGGGGNGAATTNADGQNNNQAEAEVLSKFFLALAIFFIVWLLLW